MQTQSPYIRYENFEFKPAPKKPPKMPIWVPMTLLTIALVTVTVVFITSGDAATGLGRAGMVSLGIAGACLLGLIIAFLRKRTFLGFNRTAFIVFGVFFGLLGAAGVLTEKPVHTLQADNLKKTGNYEQAIAEYRMGDDPKLKTNVSECYLKWGDQLVKDKQFDAALEKYRSSATADTAGNKFSDTARKQVGLVYLNWGLQLENAEQKNDEALAKYDEVVKDGSNQDSIDRAKNQARGIMFRVGDTQFEVGEYDKALDTYKKAVDIYGAPEADLKPYISKTYLAWGRKYLEAGDYEEAIKRLDTKIAYGTDINAYSLALVDAYAGIGQKLLNANNYEEAFNVISKAFGTYGMYDTKGQLQGMLADSLAGQAGALEANKDYAKAIQTYEKALPYLVNKLDITTSIKAKIRSLLQAQGEDYVAQEQYQKAIDSFAYSQQVYPEASVAAQLRNLIAKSYFQWAGQLEKAGDFAGALNNYRRILSNYSEQVDFTRPASDSQPRLLLALAGKQRDAKNYDAAFASYQELVDKYALTSQGQEAKNQLTAAQDVTVTVVDNNGKAVGNLKVKLDENWTKTVNGFEPKGRSLDFTTNANGSFTVKLVPGNSWMLSYTKNGDYRVSAIGDTPANLVRSTPLRATSQNQQVNLP